MASRAYASFALCLAAAGCLNPPSFLRQPKSTLRSERSETKAVVLSDSDGILSAQLDPHANATQVVAASAASKVAGDAIAFPPGTLAVATTVTVQEGAPLASSSFTQTVGLDPSVTVQAAAPTLVVQSATPVDAAQPFTVAIAVNSGSLQLAAGTTYAVLYNVFVAATNSYQAGVIPSTALSFADGKVTFQATHFGAYQLVTTSAPITVAKAVASAMPVVTAAQAAAAPMQLDNFAPLAAPAGATVTLTGRNFRPTMTVALAGVPVGKVSVASDVSASFAVPASTPFGFTDLTVAQDGTSETHKLFAMSDRKPLPIITLADPSQVCSGIGQYYDANGNIQTGTMACSTAPASATGTATHASSADSATSADFLTPLTSTAAITAAAQLPAPTGAAVFNVAVGSSPVTINAIAPAPVGTRALLVMQGPVLSALPVVTSGAAISTTGPNGPMYFAKGDELDVVALDGAGRWAVDFFNRVYASANFQPTTPVNIPPTQNTPWILPWSGDPTTGVVADSSIVSYDNTTGAFTVNQTGVYEIKESVSATAAASIYGLYLQLSPTPGYATSPMVSCPGTTSCQAIQVFSGLAFASGTTFTLSFGGGVTLTAATLSSLRVTRVQ